MHVPTVNDGNGIYMFWTSKLVDWFELHILLIRNNKMEIMTVSPLYDLLCHHLCQGLKLKPW